MRRAMSLPRHPAVAITAGGAATSFATTKTPSLRWRHGLMASRDRGACGATASTNEAAPRLSGSQGGRVRVGGSDRLQGQDGPSLLGVSEKVGLVDCAGLSLSGLSHLQDENHQNDDNEITDYAP